LVADVQRDQSDRDREEFETFFRRGFPALVGVLIKAGFSRDEALDAAEDAMVEANAQWDRIQDPGPWVRKVAIRTAIAAARRRREDVRRSVQGGWLSSAHDDHERIAVVDERSRVVALLARLPDKQRVVMVLHMEELDTDEIADLLGLEPATVRSHLRHAREKLKIAIKEFDSPGREVR
jgi:RNA polymerase sigma-70 factor (ECF subfamily)